MLRTPGQRALGIAVLAVALAALLIGHELWTPPLTRSSAVITYVDHVLVDVLGVARSASRPDAAWTQWYLYAVSTVGGLLVLVRFALHWQVRRDELALVPVSRSKTGPAEFASNTNDATTNPTTSTEERREPSAKERREPAAEPTSRRPDPEDA